VTWPGFEPGKMCFWPARGGIPGPPSFCTWSGAAGRSRGSNQGFQAAAGQAAATAVFGNGKFLPTVLARSSWCVTAPHRCSAGTWWKKLQAHLYQCNECKIKQLLCESTCLAHPDPAAAISLAVDASNTHVGAGLQQLNSGSWQQLAFYSKKLDIMQRLYSSFDRELLAAYLAVRHFRCSLEGRQFAIFTDHKPLTFAIHCISEPWLARQQQQLSYLAEFTSDFRHVPGVDNVVADAVSLPGDGNGSVDKVIAGELSQPGGGSASVDSIVAGELSQPGDGDGSVDNVAAGELSQPGGGSGSVDFAAMGQSSRNAQIVKLWSSLQC
jgi:RNase H-like domain found in reverse transcriptase